MIVLEAKKMTLRYTNGQTIDAVLLSRREGKMRVALQGSEDVVELSEVSGTWVSDECEPVQVSFGWQKQAPAPTSEEDFICPPELAAKLIRMLVSADETEEDSQASGAAAQERTASAVPVV